MSDNNLSNSEKHYCKILTLLVPNFDTKWNLMIRVVVTENWRVKGLYRTCVEKFQNET